MDAGNAAADQAVGFLQQRADGGELADGIRPERFAVDTEDDVARLEWICYVMIFRVLAQVASEE